VGSAVESPAAEATRGFDEPGLVEALTGLSEIEPYTIRLAYDLGTVRIVVLARAEQDQSVSVVELLPPPDLTLDSMQAAFDGRGSAEPLEILGYDSVQVLERRSGRLGGHEASFATIQWQRTAPEESGAGSVAWLLCEGSDRWVFVSEEVRGSSHDPSVNADLIESFELCPTGS